MTETARLPELIISLSQDKVMLHLLENVDRGISAWQSSFPVSGMFMEDDIGKALDTALQENPALMEDFDLVHIVILDRPNLYLPKYLLQERKLNEITSTYLRMRAGDTLTLDETSGEDVICYTLPQSTFDLIREYYSTTDNVHLISLLWKEMKREIVAVQDPNPSLYFSLTGNNLIVLCSREGKLSFSKRFSVREQADVYYYVMACTRLLRPSKKIQIQIQEESSPFGMPDTVHFSVDQRLSFPSIPTLLSIHYPCAS